MARSTHGGTRQQNGNIDCPVRLSAVAFLDDPAYQLYTLLLEHGGDQ
jgi:hypothetical protein